MPSLNNLQKLIEQLEAIASDRSLLSGVSDVDRARLLRALAEIYSPDRVQRRRLSKIVQRRRKAARVKQDQSALAGTGIRTLRNRPVHTPNYFLSGVNGHS